MYLKVKINKRSINKSGMLYGTMLLTLSGLFVKVVGALNWVILSRVIGTEGLGLYQLSFPLYLLAITIGTTGTPVALAILMTEQYAKGSYLGIRKILNCALGSLLALGMVFSVVILYGGKYLIDIGYIQDSRVYSSLVALAPAVIWVNILSVYRGYFQGAGAMGKLAFADVLEQVFRVVSMCFLGWIFLSYGLEYAVAGASSGACIGALGAVIYLFSSARRQKSKELFMVQNSCLAFSTEETKELSTRNILRRLLAIALPITLANLTVPIVANIDMLLVPMKLAKLGFTTNEATTLFGCLTGIAVPLMSLAAIPTTALATNLLPAISKARFKGKEKEIRIKTAKALGLALVCGTIGSFLLYYGGEWLAVVIYAAPKASLVVHALSLGCVFLCLVQTSNAILQGLGFVRMVLAGTLISSLVKVVLNYYLIDTLGFGILGAAYATVIDLGVGAAFNLFFVYRAVYGDKVEK